MTGDLTGPAAFLAALGALFGGYGLGELALACRCAGPFGEWLDRALPGAGGVLAGALFACCAHHLLATGAAGGLAGALPQTGHPVPAAVQDAPARPAPALPEKGGPPPLARRARRIPPRSATDMLRRGASECPAMRTVLLACALVLGTAAGCSSSYVPGEYAAVAYRAPAPAEAAEAPARKRRVRSAAAARRRTAPAPLAGPAEAARPAPPQQAAPGPG